MFIVSRRQAAIDALCCGVAAMVSVSCSGRSSDAGPAKSVAPNRVSASAPAKLLGAVKLSESTLRRVAIVQPMPEYPAAALSDHIAGVVVAEIMATAGGVVEKVQILQAPDRRTGDAVVAALKQWRFKDVTLDGSTQPLKPYGRVTFYFSVEHGAGVVRNPETAQAASTAPAAAPSAARELGEAELQQLRKSTRIVLLDVRDRDDYRWQHRDQAVNIPFDELTVRAPRELSGFEYVVVDCASFKGDMCRAAPRLLASAGVSHIGVLVP